MKAVILVLCCCAAGLVNRSYSQESSDSYTEVSYRKLGSPAFQDDYTSTLVSFKAMFLGEDAYVNLYQQQGGRTADMVFINHRDSNHQLPTRSADSSDFDAPPQFAISVPKDKADSVFGLKRGDVVEVKGEAIHYYKSLFGMKTSGVFQVIAHEIVNRGPAGRPAPAPLVSSPPTGASQQVDSSSTGMREDELLSAEHNQQVTTAPAKDSVQELPQKVIAPVIAAEPVQGSGPADQLLRDLEGTP